MKKGIRRIKPAPRTSPANNADMALECLQRALFHARLAGSCYTVARIRYAISSAKGAVRAAGYRESREVRRANAERAARGEAQRIPPLRVQS